MTGPLLPLEALPLPAVVVDVAGRVTAANLPWQEGGAAGDPPWRGRGEGDRLVREGEPGGEPLRLLLEDVLSGARPGGEAALPPPHGGRGFRVRVTALEQQGRRDALVVALPQEAVAPDEPSPRGFVVERAADGFFLSDSDGRIRELNPSVERLSGRDREGLLGQDLEELLCTGEPGGFHAELDRLLEASPSVLLEAALLTSDGARVPVEISAQRLPDGGVQGVVRDISGRRDLEEQLRISQRIESIGRLAGGIAHDFNNLITVISGHTDLLLATIPDGNVLREDLHEIRAAATRAAGLTRQLLAFSRRQVFELRNLDLNEVVEGTQGMLRRIIGEDVEFVFVPSTSLGAVRGDPAQLEQVLMNLVVNARDAMPRGGELLIRTSNVELDDEFVRRNLGSHPGRHVLLEVRDTGEGMPAEVAERVFEPFFTTKGPGKGTGLGLAMVYGIVKQSDGYIALETEPGVGTAVRLYFPMVPGPAQGLGEVGEGPVGLVHGSETILLVEDEEMVRGLARRILEALDYRVVEAGDATEAMERAREMGNEVDLLLTDVVMPRISGRQLAESLRDERPSLPVLFMSGYTDDALMQHGALSPGQGFLQKPFTPLSLSRKIREVLDG